MALQAQYQQEARAIQRGVHPLTTSKRYDVVDLDIGLPGADAEFAVSLFPPTFLAGVGGPFQRPPCRILPVEMPQVFLLVVVAAALCLEGVGLPAPPADAGHALKARTVRVVAVAAPPEGLTDYTWHSNTGYTHSYGKVHSLPQTTGLPCSPGILPLRAAGFSG